MRPSAGGGLTLAGYVLFSMPPKKELERYATDRRTPTDWTPDGLAVGEGTGFGFPSPPLM